tara:strand:+ start:467 stop:700 length:234 start_codon:yes stop_codon:yes gene_type:complete
MSNFKTLKAEVKTSSKGNRVISDYTNDLIFEQPRENLLQQEFVSYEYVEHGVKITTITRKFQKSGDYQDCTTVQIIG